MKQSNRKPSTFRTGPMGTNRNKSSLNWKIVGPLIVVIMVGAFGVWKLIDTYAATPTKVSINAGDWKTFTRAGVIQEDGKNVLELKKATTVSSTASTSLADSSVPGGYVHLKKLTNFVVANKTKKVNLCVTAKRVQNVTTSTILRVQARSMANSGVQASYSKSKDFALANSYKEYCYNFSLISQDGINYYAYYGAQVYLWASNSNTQVRVKAVELRLI